MGFLASRLPRPRPRKTSSFPSRLFPKPHGPPPPQIDVSTPVYPAGEAALPDEKPPGSHPSGHLTIEMPQSEPAPGSSRLPPSSQMTPLMGERIHEQSQLLDVIPPLSHDERLRRARRASHSDVHTPHGSPPAHFSYPHGLGPPVSLAHHQGLGHDFSRAASPAPSLRSGVPPSSFKDLAVLYQVVAERRTAFDNLLWQVPATSLTAHAFLFSISLASDTGRFARIASMGLCIVITVLTLHLFTRQLQAEDADHRWLADFEERHQIDYYDRAHGDRWKDYRAQKPAGAGRLGWLAMHRSYPLWSKGMLIIGFLAVAILILAIFDQSILLGYNCQIP